MALFQVEQNWATLQGGEMTIQTTQASEATQAVASLAEAAVAASQDIQPGATVTMALNRYTGEGASKGSGWGGGAVGSVGSSLVPSQVSSSGAGPRRPVTTAHLSPATCCLSQVRRAERADSGITGGTFCSWNPSPKSNQRPVGNE